jgi:hypothetical protein
MASKFVTTDRPGVYLRGRIYYASVTQNGVTKRIAAGPKKDDAVRLKRQLEADRDRGKTVIARREKEKLRDYALSWIESTAAAARPASAR